MSSVFDLNGLVKLNRYSYVLSLLEITTIYCRYFLMNRFYKITCIKLNLKYLSR